MLSAVFSVLAGLALLILLVLVIVVCLPVHLDFRFNTKTEPAMDVRVGLFGGTLDVPISSREVHKKTQKHKKPKTAKKLKSGRSRSDFVPMLKHLPRLLSRLIGIVKLENMRATFDFGFDSPADTGMVYGMLSPFERTIGRRPKCQVTLHPDFDGAKFESKGHAAARFVPAAIFPPLIGFGWSAFLKPRLTRRLR